MPNMFGPWRVETLQPGFRQFIERAGVLRTINTDYAPSAEGNVVKIPYSKKRAGGDFTPGVVPANTANYVAESRTFTIDKWKFVEVLTVSNLETTNVSPEIFAAELTTAAQSLAEMVEKDILANLWRGSKGCVNLSAAPSVESWRGLTQPIRDAFKFMRQNSVPSAMRYMGLSPDGEAYVTGIEQAVAADSRGDAGVIVPGNIGMLSGAMVYSTSNMPENTGVSDGTLVNGAVAIGSTTFNFDSGTVRPGVMIQFGNGAERYLVKGVDGNTATLDRATTAAIADNAPVRAPDGVQSHLYYRDSLAFAMRNPRGLVIGGSGALQQELPITDPESGFGFRVVMQSWNGQTRVYIDTGYGYGQLQEDAGVGLSPA